MSTMDKPTIGIVGAGKFGIALGKLAVSAGYKVYIANSKDAESIRLTIDILVNGAIASSVEEINKEADIVFLAVPLSKYRKIDSEMFKGKVLIDCMNYWWEVDGLDNIYSDEKESSSEKVQNYFNKSNLVKAFNHIGYHDLLDDSIMDKTENRKVVLFASDHQQVNHIIDQLIFDFGFIGKYIGPLRTGKILETGSALFGASLDLEKIEEIVNDSLKNL